MGKLQSKHECIFVNAHLNKALEAQIWKQKTGCNLANYNMDDTISELSICVADKEDGSPLRVDLPPQKLLDTDTSRVLKLDQGEDEEKKENMDEGTVEQKLNIEEFECGVHFEGTESSKQEWSFTLYDFDGHGKITKEDLASLLKALYDAVGSSIKLPHNGTKTLKLRLTVGQDNAQLHSARISSAKSKDSPKVKDGKTKETIKAKDFAKLNNLTTQQLNVKCNNEKQTPNGKTRNQLSLEDQQQLAELVQENMERNHIKQLRRHHSDCRNTEGSHHKRRHRNRLPQIVDETPKESQDRRNYYLDLAGIENNATEFQNTPSMPTAGSGVVHLGNGHHRSRSHDVTTQKYDNAKRESDRLCKQIDSPKLDHKSRSHEIKEEPTEKRSPKGHKNVTSVTSPQKHGKYRPVSLPAHVPNTVSPHYHRRHRHREKNHDMAMQQVAEWIEREHTWDVDGEKIVIQRHEHHHVHEHHHHHHYHHYYEA
ncbi:protein naked cuticle homolog 1 isoform X2 [Patella vulgata]|uniref:protein naked cuticle homolog 1 isoform X2 n=1 Tax=Patella vulgata TaxID=6465 RepID=UPI00217FDB05|nr:protein naked cuticle homolog 1 isoform X2 [Patella vulgata]